MNNRSKKSAWAGKFSGYTFYFRPRRLTEPILRELWQFRALHVGLKQGVDPEEDFTTFSEIIRKGSLSLIRRDRTGAVRGMSHFSEQPYVFEGRRFILIKPEYVFFDKGFHKEFGAPIATIWTIIRARIRWPAHRIYIGGPVYLGGFMTVCQLTKPVWLWNDEGIPEWERGAFSQVASHAAGWNPATGVVHMRTFMRQPRTKPPRITRLNKDAIHYTTQYPKWYEGYTPFCFARLHILSIVMITRSFFMRFKKHA